MGPIKPVSTPVANRFCPLCLPMPSGCSSVQAGMAEEAGGGGEGSKPLHTPKQAALIPTGCCRPGQPLQHFLQEEMPGGQREGKRRDSVLSASCLLFIPFLRDPGLLEHRECQQEEKVWRILMVCRQGKRGRA